MANDTKQPATNETSTAKKPGVCIPFEEAAAEWPPIESQPELVRKVWEDVDGLGYAYIWQLLVSF